MEDKRGMQLAISTLILFILGFVVLIGLISILVMGWDDFKMQIGVVLGSDTAKAQKNCKIQCELENSYDYCCEIKEVKEESLKCTDDLLKGDCVLDCSGVSCDG